MTANLLAIDRHKPLNTITRGVDATAWITWRLQSKLIYFEAAGAARSFSETTQSVLFPTSAIFSVSSSSPTGDFAEASLIGHEGCVGMWSLCDSSPSHIATQLQTTGYVLAIPKDFLRVVFRDSSAFRCALLDHAALTIKYATQTCYCYRHHSIQQQVVKMLLLTIKRTRRTDIEISHQLIATALGIRREGVSTALKRLQSLQLIDQRRCHIYMLDEKALEIQACSCYPIICGYLGYTDNGGTIKRRTANDL
jgi:CRP-like cAMP-binding protein